MSISPACETNVNWSKNDNAKNGVKISPITHVTKQAPDHYLTLAHKTIQIITIIQNKMQQFAQLIKMSGTFPRVELNVACIYKLIRLLEIENINGQDDVNSHSDSAHSYSSVMWHQAYVMNMTTVTFRVTKNQYHNDKTRPRTKEDSDDRRRALNIKSDHVFRKSEHLLLCVQCPSWTFLVIPDVRCET